MQTPAGSWIAPTLAQLPALPVTAQDRQLPQGPLEQQTPSVQNVLRHCAPEVQAAPRGLRLVQLPPWQVSPETHWLSLLHVVRHWLLPPHT